MVILTEILYKEIRNLDIQMSIVRGGPIPCCAIGCFSADELHRASCSVYAPAYLENHVSDMLLVLYHLVSQSYLLSKAEGYLSLWARNRLDGLWNLHCNLLNDP